MRTWPVVRSGDGFRPRNPETRKHVLTVGSGQCLQTGSTALHGPVTKASQRGLASQAAQQEAMVAFGIGGTMIPWLTASCCAVALQFMLLATTGGRVGAADACRQHATAATRHRTNVAMSCGRRVDVAAGVGVHTDTQVHAASCTRYRDVGMLAAAPSRF